MELTLDDQFGCLFVMERERIFTQLNGNQLRQVYSLFITRAATLKENI